MPSKFDFSNISLFRKNRIFALDVTIWKCIIHPYVSSDLGYLTEIEKLLGQAVKQYCRDRREKIDIKMKINIAWNFDIKLVSVSVNTFKQEFKEKVKMRETPRAQNG